MTLFAFVSKVKIKFRFWARKAPPLTPKVINKKQGKTQRTSKAQVSPILQPLQPFAGLWRLHHAFAIRKNGKSSTISPLPQNTNLKARLPVKSATIATIDPHIELDAVEVTDGRLPKGQANNNLHKIRSSNTNLKARTPVKSATIDPHIELDTVEVTDGCLPKGQANNNLQNMFLLGGSNSTITITASTTHTQTKKVRYTLLLKQKVISDGLLKAVSLPQKPDTVEVTDGRLVKRAKNSNKPTAYSQKSEDYKPGVILLTLDILPPLVNKAVHIDAWKCRLLMSQHPSKKLFQLAIYGR